MTFAIEEAHSEIWKRHSRESQGEAAMAELFLDQVGERICFRPDLRWRIESELG